MVEELYVHLWSQIEHTAQTRELQDDIRFDSEGSVLVLNQEEYKLKGFLVVGSDGSSEFIGQTEVFNV